MNIFFLPLSLKHNSNLGIADVKVELQIGSDDVDDFEDVDASLDVDFEMFISPEK